jgi:hypothetical protein
MRIRWSPSAAADPQQISDDLQKSPLPYVAIYRVKDKSR